MPPKSLVSHAEVSSINLAPVTYFQDEDADCVVFDASYYTVVAHSIFPQLAQAPAFEGLTHTARIVPTLDPCP